MAHHLAIGLTDIQIYQNDSSDHTEKHLRTLHKLGIIEFFKNPSRNRTWQNKAYRRASRSETHKASDWCMPLDGDEFLHISGGTGLVGDLIDACVGADEILINCKFFGRGGATTFDDSLITDRFTACEAVDNIRCVEAHHSSPCHSC